MPKAFFAGEANRAAAVPDTAGKPGKHGSQRVQFQCVEKAEAPLAVWHSPVAGIGGLPPGRSQVVVPSGLPSMAPRW